MSSGDDQPKLPHEDATEDDEVLDLEFEDIMDFGDTSDASSASAIEGVEMLDFLDDADGSADETPKDTKAPEAPEMTIDMAAADIPASAKVDDASIENVDDLEFVDEVDFADEQEASPESDAVEKGVVEEEELVEPLENVTPPEVVEPLDDVGPLAEDVVAADADDAHQAVADVADFLEDDVDPQVTAGVGDTDVEDNLADAEEVDDFDEEMFAGIEPSEPTVNHTRERTAVTQREDLDSGDVEEVGEIEEDFALRDDDAAQGGDELGDLTVAAAKPDSSQPDVNFAASVTPTSMAKKEKKKKSGLPVVVI
jgi:hypothetical protein